MARPGVTVRKYKMGEEPIVDEETRRMTAGERIELAWQVTVTAWGMYDPAAIRAGFRRDVARVIRGRR
ncbi:MAG TPA: hypothetical protein VNN08_20700 [Thermoanaerobaculia bacterium]|nr:hypothetical protein [Thermoanaerobaculia bacterium]